MHEIIKRYAGKARLVNDLGLLVYRYSPNFLRRAAVSSLYELRKNKLPGVKFLIFAQGRTGSTVLVDLMNSHPEVVSFGEILAENVIRNVPSPRKWAEGICSLSKRPACGFKVKVYQIEGVQGKDPQATVSDFHQHGWKLIYLKRSNLLRHAISDIRSEKTGLFHLVEKEGEVASSCGPRGPVRIEWEELLKAIHFRERCLAEEARALEGLPHLPIEYEAGILDPQALPQTMNRVYEFLGLPPHAAGTSFRKVSAKNISDDIENFDELERRLQHTEYARFLGWG
jgi:LPS sulfotransferase NodH